MDITQIPADEIFEELLRRIAGEGDLEVNSDDRVGSMGRMSRVQFVFNAATAVTPCVELLVIHPDGDKVLLTYRDDQDLTGWHFPGKALAKGEMFEECCNRVAGNELGIQVKNIQRIGECNYLNTKRFHQNQPFLSHWLGLIYTAQPASNIDQIKGKWFRISTIPSNIIVQHRRVWLEILIPSLISPKANLKSQKPPSSVISIEV